MMLVSKMAVARMSVAKKSEAIKMSKAKAKESLEASKVKGIKGELRSIKSRIGLLRRSALLFVPLWRQILCC